MLFRSVKNENVTDFRFALVESDNMELDKQNALIRELELPVAYEQMFIYNIYREQMFVKGNFKFFTKKKNTVTALSQFGILSASYIYGLVFCFIIFCIDFDSACRELINSNG